MNTRTPTGTSKTSKFFRLTPRLHLGIGALLILLQNNATAAPIASYNFAAINLADCHATCFDSDDTRLAAPAQQDFGTTGLATAHVIGSMPGVQSGGSSGFGATAYEPTLSAYGYSAGSYRSVTGTYGMQRYEFTAAGTLTIGGTLTWSQSGYSTTTTNSLPAGRTRASLYAFQMATNVFDLDDCITSNPDLRLVINCSRLSGQTILGHSLLMKGQYNFQQSDFVIGSGAVSNGSVTNYLTISGNVGDVFFLASSLQVTPHLGGFADSRNTLKTNIDNPAIVKASFANNTFKPAPMAAPEPSLAVLMMGGLLFLHRSSKKREA
jgi:hypothetical protein